ncbi:MAG: hypothetical protein DRJ42_11460 [Deltaproteobacteria bacterium]|nr:MAG: hypothetical protein DRJ42_11460 [Deltaproteobacteria bacterium]
MSAGVLAALALLALGSATLSAVTGIGGVLLLSGLLVAVPTVAVVPLHGAVQLAAGGSRVLGFRKHIRWDVALPFMAGLLPGSLVGIGAVAWLAAISPSVLKALIAVTILLSLTVRPKTSQTRPAAQALVGGGQSEAATAVTSHRLLFVSVGMLVGVLGIIVGAAGSIVTQALLTAGVVKEEHIATKSTIQATSNLIKVPLFGFALSFDYAEYALPLTVMMVAVVAGTFLGKRLLGMLSTQRFVFLARALLFLVAMQMLVAEAARALDLV